jgi:hypothetical protein
MAPTADDELAPSAELDLTNGHLATLADVELPSGLQVHLSSAVAAQQTAAMACCDSLLLPAPCQRRALM